MRFYWIGAAIAATFGLAGPAIGQSVYDGPLAAPNATAPSAAPDAATPTHRHPKPRKVRHAAKASDDDFGKAVPATAAAPLHKKTPAEDPLSLGMKWNGSNDTAAQTRVQNYNGNAVGTGAEVGLKLHF